jgi:phosphoenolpyruvate mutase
MFSRPIITNANRVKSLKRILKEKGFIRIIEVHNGLSALIGNNAQVTHKKDVRNFDGFWESSLTDSASKGLPDIELVSSDSRLHTITQILDVTTKPLIVDGDTGGEDNQFRHLVRKLESAGVSMVIIEDKVFPKRNSFANADHELENVDRFAEKIRKGAQAKQDSNFMIIARLEGLIAGRSMEDTLKRAKVFLAAGADGIMIHSKSSEPTEILEFAKRYQLFPKKLIRGKVLVCVPTTYNSITAQELANAGFSVIIYANHQLRVAYAAMEEACESILLHDRSHEVESLCAPLKELFQTVGMLEIIAEDNALRKERQV